MEHIIGMLFENTEAYLVTPSELKEFVREDCRTYEYAHAHHIPLPYICYKYEDYFDRRKSTNLCRFKYCPECGASIDWARMRREITNDKH